MEFMVEKEETMVFLVSNSKLYGQHYYDKKKHIIYRCRFQHPSPGAETVPFSWILVISFLVFVFHLPFFFVYPSASLLLNLGFFILEVCLGTLFNIRKRRQAEKSGVTIELRDLDVEKLQELKKEIMQGIIIYSGLGHYYFTGMVFMLFVVGGIFLYGGYYVLSLNFMLYAVESLGYNFYFTTKKHQKDLLNEIDSLLKESGTGDGSLCGTGDGSLSHDEKPN